MNTGRLKEKENIMSVPVWAVVMVIIGVGVGYGLAKWEAWAKNYDVQVPNKNIFVK